MLLTGSRWFWISSPWLSMQACSHTPAGRCDGRALPGQHSGALSMTQTLTLSLPIAQVSDWLCAGRVGQTWTVRLGESCPGLPALGLPQLSQVQYRRNKFVGSPDCNQLCCQIKSAVILCITRVSSLFFVCVCVPLPCRNIPLAVIVSVITVIVGYMLTNVSYYTVLGTEDVLASPAVAVVSCYCYCYLLSVASLCCGHGKPFRDGFPIKCFITL